MLELYERKTFWDRWESKLNEPWEPFETVNEIEVAEHLQDMYEYIVRVCMISDCDEKCRFMTNLGTCVFAVDPCEWREFYDTDKEGANSINYHYKETEEYRQKKALEDAKYEQRKRAQDWLKKYELEQALEAQREKRRAMQEDGIINT